jgi:hypothetical protein
MWQIAHALTAGAAVPGPRLGGKSGISVDLPRIVRNES